MPSSGTQLGVSGSSGGVATSTSPLASSTSAAQAPVASIPSTPTSALSPEGLAQNFNAGSQAGAPMSAGTEALSTGAMHAAQPQAPLHTERMAPAPIASTAPTSGMPLFETAHAATPVEAPPPVAPPAGRLSDRRRSPRRTGRTRHTLDRRRSADRTRRPTTRLRCRPSPGRRDRSGRPGPDAFCHPWLCPCQSRQRKSAQPARRRPATTRQQCQPRPRPA